jgi:hydroxyacylglutathione hydrolase
MPAMPPATMPSSMIVETFPVGALGCNCSIVGDAATKEAIVIDPGGDLEQIRERLDANGLTVRALLHTHTHIDHVGATADLQRATGAAARIHEADHFLYQILPIQAQLIGLRDAPATSELDRFLVDDETISLGELSLHVLHTPGHTPGSCCFEVRGRGGGDEQVLLFAGDTLFLRSVGRTDLWGGDSQALVSSVRKKLFTLPDPTRVICGHGDDTTIEAEKRLNPFVGLRAR